MGAGAVAALGLAPWGLWVLTFPMLVLLFWLRGFCETRRGAFALGWAFGAGWFGLGLSWIVEPFLVDIARHGWMAPFALVFMCGGMALFWGGAFAAAHRRALPLLVALWTAAEMVRGVVFTGFPWAQPGHVLIDTPFAQLAALGGSHLLTIAVLGLSATAAAIGARLWLIAPALACAGAWLALDPGPAPRPDPAAPLVRLVQPNATQALKWDPEMSRVFYRRLIELTGEGPRPDLVVWPETALPGLLEQSQAALEAGSEAARGAPVALGIQRREGSRYYNSAVVIDRTGAVVSLYDKSHLVPFGEFIPFGETLGKFGIQGLASSEGGGFTPGPELHPVHVPGIGQALPLICYEGIFPDEINAAAATGALRPRLMLLMTNDGWFGTVSGPYQHFAQARLRAIEQRMPMVRVANTGVSGMIDTSGRVTARLGLGETGAVDAALPPRGPAPVYARLGDVPVMVFLGLLATLGFRRWDYALDRRRGSA